MPAHSSKTSRPRKKKKKKSKKKRMGDARQAGPGFQPRSKPMSR